MILLRVIAAISMAAATPFVAAAAQPAHATGEPLLRLANGIEGANPKARIRITALSNSIIRVRIGRGGKFPEDASWAVPAAVRRQSVVVKATADGFRTNGVAVHLNPTTLQLTVTDLAGRTISVDQPDAVRFEGRGFTLQKVLPIDEHIFGLETRPGRSTAAEEPSLTGTATPMASRPRATRSTSRSLSISE